MRTRQQIESEMPQINPLQNFGGHGTKYTYEVLIAELLLDIRDLLIPSIKVNEINSETVVIEKPIKNKKTK